QAAGDLEQLLLAAAERGSLGRGLAPQCRKAVECRLDASTDIRIATGRDAAELQIVEHRKLGKDIAPLRYIANAGIEKRARLGVGDIAALESDMTRPDRKEAEHRLEHGRFPSTVGADDGGDGTTAHREG